MLFDSTAQMLQLTLQWPDALRFWGFPEFIVFQCVFEEPPGLILMSSGRSPGSLFHHYGVSLGQFSLVFKTKAKNRRRGSRSSERSIERVAGDPKSLLFQDFVQCIFGMSFFYDFQSNKSFLGPLWLPKGI